MLAGRLASLVHVMRGRWSPLHRLSVLALDGDVFSLSDSSGAPLFAVPAVGVEARPQRRLALHQVFFKVHAGSQWWYLAAHVPTKYERRSTHELVERYDLREWAPRPLGMNDATYVRRTANPLTHQAVWAACWLQALNLARAGEGST